MDTKAEAVMRPRFSEGDFITVDRLTAEHEYRDLLARRHQLGAHTWGIVAGLTVGVVNNAIEIRPGLAVDGMGRSLVVEQPVRIDIDPTSDGELYLSVAAREAVDRPTQACDGRRSGPVTVVCASPSMPQIPFSSPTGVGPMLTDEPNDGYWPVPLGHATWTGGTITMSAVGLVYAGLIGEEVAAASGTAAMTVGSVKGRASGRFSVRTATSTSSEQATEDSADAATQDQQAATNDADSATSDQGLTERFWVDSTGDTHFVADTLLQGGALVDPAGLDLSHDHLGLEFKSLKLPEAARAWNVYRTHTEVDGRTIRELRVELFHPGDDGQPDRQRFVIGVFRDGSFEPCLTVDADCTVTITGNLDVEGVLFEGPIPGDPTDPRLVLATAANFGHGAASGATQLGSIYQAGGISVAISVPPSDQIAIGSVTTIVVDVTNTGSVLASDAHVYLTILEDDEQVMQQDFALGGLAPGEAGNVTYDYTAPAQADVGVTVNVLTLGVGPTFIPLSDTATVPFTTFDPDAIGDPVR